MFLRFTGTAAILFSLFFSTSFAHALPDQKVLEVKSLAEKIAKNLSEARQVVIGAEATKANAEAACDVLLKNIQSGDFSLAADNLDEARRVAMRVLNRENTGVSALAVRPLEDIYADFNCALGKVTGACQNKVEVQVMQNLLTNYRDLFLTGAGYFAHYGAFVTMLITIPVSNWSSYFSGNPALSVPYFGFAVVATFIGFYYWSYETSDGYAENHEARKAMAAFLSKVTGAQVTAEAVDAFLTKRRQSKLQRVFWEELWQQLNQKGFDIPRFSKEKWLSNEVRFLFVDSLYGNKEKALSDGKKGIETRDAEFEDVEEEAPVKNVRHLRKE